MRLEIAIVLGLTTASPGWAATIPPGDPPRAEDLTRAAELAAVPPPIVERSPRFAPDGKRVAFVANYDGSPSLYIQETGGQTPRRVTKIEGRFRRPEFSPDGKYVYFTSDTNGDEAYAIRRVDLATGETSEVVGGEKLRRNGPAFVGRGDRFFFTARAMTARGLVLFQQQVAADAKASLVFQDEELRLSAIRPDGQQLAVVPAHGDTLFLVDLPARSRRRVYPPSEAGPRFRLQGVTYSPDGTRLFVAFHDDEDRLHLRTVETGTVREIARYTDPVAPGGDVHALQAVGGTLAFVLDVGTQHFIRVLDAETLKPRCEPDLPAGSEVPGAAHPNSTPGLAVSRDGRRLAVEWSSPSAPSRVYLIDTDTGRREALNDVPRPALPPVDVQVVRVKSFDGLEVPVLVYGGGAAGARRPVILSIHGGFPFAATARYSAEIVRYVGEGYVVVEPNVRGSAGNGARYELADDGAKKLDGVRDFRAVADWIAAQPWADRGRMAVMGRSAGGYYTLLCLAHQPEIWRAGVAVVPLYDLAAALDAMDGDLREFLMNKELVPASEPAILAAISPSTYVERIRAPVLVYAGANDVRTPTAQIHPLVTTLRERGRPVEYMFAPNEGHSMGAGSTRAELDARILRFLREAMEPEEKGRMHPLDRPGHGP